MPLLDVYRSSPLLVFAFFTAVMAIALWKMADRTHEEPRWFAIVPILNLVLMLRIARRPMWWLILFVIPLVNLVALIAVTMALCERFGVNKWWGLAAVLSPLNLILYLYLAYGTKEGAPPVAQTPEPTKP